MSLLDFVPGMRFLPLFGDDEWCYFGRDRALDWGFRWVGADDDIVFRMFKSTGTEIHRLGDAAGSSCFEVQDVNSTVLLSVCSDGVLSFSGGGAFSHKIPDNTARAFAILEGSNDYTLIDTRDGAEVMAWGNATTDPDFTFLGAGTMKIGVAPGSLDTVNIDGGLDIIHTSTAQDDHALEIDLDAAGFGDVKALDIAYTTGALAVGSAEAAALVNVDGTGSTGGTVHGFEVIGGGGSARLVGMLTGPTVAPIVQLSGTPGDADTILVKAVDETAALASGGAGNISVFVADNDTITVGDAAQFEEIVLVLDTASSGSGIAPTFRFSTGVGTWTSFVPVDGTNGLRNTGAIVWEDADVSTFAPGTGSEYLIEITRTRNSLSTAPIVDEVQIVGATQYGWDKDGVITASKLGGLTASFDFSGSGAVTETGMTNLTLTPTGTMYLQGGGVSRFGDDTGYFEFNGGGTVTETGMAAFTLTPSGVITLDSGSTATLTATTAVIFGDAGDPTIDFAGAGAFSMSGNPTVNLGTGVLTLNTKVLTMAPHAVDLGDTVRRATVSISAAQTRALAGTPITIVATPPSGFINVVLWVMFELNYGATAHDDAAADGNLVVQYNSGSTIIAIHEADGYVDSVADATWAVFVGEIYTATQTNLLKINDAIELTNDGAEYTGTGDSTLEVTVHYVTIPTQL